jgi:hypothetical protein
MPSYPSLEQIKMTVFSLPLNQQEWLLGELDQHIKQELNNDLDSMANDVQVQAELAKINDEFLNVEMDGLGNL